MITTGADETKGRTVALEQGEFGCLTTNEMDRWRQEFERFAPYDKRIVITRDEIRGYSSRVKPVQPVDEAKVITIRSMGCIEHVARDDDEIDVSGKRSGNHTIIRRGNRLDQFRLPFGCQVGETTHGSTHVNVCSMYEREFPGHAISVPHDIRHSTETAPRSETGSWLILCSRRGYADSA